MNILILGGTIFLGRALVEEAKRRGHTVTLFNRGLTNGSLFPKVEKLYGYRDSDLDALQGRQWDAVIDTCGFVPRVVRKSVNLLARSVGQYVYISSISVYADTSQPGMKEDAPTVRLETEIVDESNSAYYGPFKAQCEQVVQSGMIGRSLIVRPGLMVGPHDETDRFSYWPFRIAQGGEVMAPGRPERPIQFIDVRDVAAWIITQIENQQNGVFNVASPDGWATMGSVLQACMNVIQSDAELKWVPEDFLMQNSVGEWIEMPLWLAESDPSVAGFLRFDVSRALATGLKLRPVEDTIRDTLNWVKTWPHDRIWQAGMSRARENDLLNIFLRGFFAY
jgi:nucleoside-diphosphate-sugar epimerase